ncbi:MAG: ThiF family adenylyltransferase [Methylococcales bacterium]
MNYTEIANYLRDKGYLVTIGETGGVIAFEVLLDIDGQQLKLIHTRVNELQNLPLFYLKDPSDFGNLAHVLPFSNAKYGSICVSDQDSISINFEKPMLVFEDSLKRHIDLLSKVILDKGWNEHELLREFYSNWLNICSTTKTDFICAASGAMEEIKIFNPVSDRKWGCEGKYLGITESATSLADFSYIARQGSQKRSIAGDGFVIPLDNLNPAPANVGGITEWYIQTIQNNNFPVSFMQKKGKRFWLIFNAETPSGLTWFGLNLDFKGKGKKTLPKKAENLSNWDINPISITIFNKERLMPRSGANLDLEKKSVLLIGCGSVGGEIALKIGAAGIGEINLCDPDEYSLDNIYRHVLNDVYIGCNKALAIKFSLESKYPWIKTKHLNGKLLDLRNKKFIESYDLILIAIGSPTHERLFHDFLLENNIKTPVINTWLEGYGIGGHAVLDLQDKNGCLRCAYVDLQTGSRGLASNINFLEPNQDLTINHAGCGDLFLPYNAASAAQTALIVTDLAIQVLLGENISSSKVSWKGRSHNVESAGFSVTHRYTAFNESLEVLPLYNDDCDICNG